MIIAHVFIGILLSIAINKFYRLKKITIPLRLNLPIIKNLSESFLIVSAFAFGSILPDLDIPFIKIIGWEIEHRQLLTHSAVPYILLVIIFLLLTFLFYNIPTLKKQTNARTIIVLLLFLFIASLLHVCTDIFTAPSLLFAPIYIKTIYYPLFPFDPDPNWFKNYVYSPNIFLELIPFILALVLLPSSLKNKRELMYMLFFLGILLTSIFLTLIPFI